MYRPITDIINAAPLCFQEKVELNAFDEETAGKEKLNKAASKVLGTLQRCWLLWVTFWPFEHADICYWKVGFSDGLLFGGGLLKESSFSSEAWLSLQMKVSCALGCIMAGIERRQLWNIPPTTWRMKMGADPLSQNHFGSLLFPACVLGG